MHNYGVRCADVMPIRALYIVLESIIAVFYMI